MSEEKKPGGKDQAKKELLGLLKDKSLTPEEHKKILTIATSLDSPGTPRPEPEEKGSKVSTVALVLVAVLGITLLALAWYFLNKFQKQFDSMRSKKTVSPAEQK